MRKRLIAGLAAVIALSTPAWAEITTVKATKSVAETMEALEAAVTGAGATVMARVDHAAGAKKVEMDLAPEQLLIFGNPKLGTPPMQQNALAGLYLPLKVLVYEDTDGQVWLAYEDPKDILPELDGIDAEAAYLAKMSGALAKFTSMAAGK
ncbi:DUF302 domain-containing protein [Lentibacter algarum]|uniref:DUF302 domain-containing protein n=1 Tax=Lentibacter algarum TaxID=576131 RepID=UPI001C0A1EEA|nr:DUF302 domain-containing protein [Lentibacter algarum]MBU2983306.1 DUF302 domain-containing protein [Lentibacter algarum]